MKAQKSISKFVLAGVAWGNQDNSAIARVIEQAIKEKAQKEKESV
jgi:hypothetical protein